MKKRIIVLISILMFAICFSGCSKTEISTKPKDKSDQHIDGGYEISTMTYVKEEVNDDINIQYPKVSGIENEVMEKKINDRIKSEALKIYNEYNDEDLGHLDLDVKYSISLENEYFLSIHYVGVADLEMAPHPHKLFYTTNIDMQTGNRLRLVDIVDIDEGLIEMFVNGDFKLIWPEQEESELSHCRTYDVAEKSFIDADSEENMGSVFSYMTKDSLGLTIPTEHSIGGYAQFEIKYKEIVDYLKFAGEKWSESIFNTEE